MVHSIGDFPLLMIYSYTSYIIDIEWFQSTWQTVTITLHSLVYELVTKCKRPSIKLITAINAVVCDTKWNPQKTGMKFQVDRSGKCPYSRKSWFIFKVSFNWGVCRILRPFTWKKMFWNSCKISLLFDIDVILL